MNTHKTPDNRDEAEAHRVARLDEHARMLINRYRANPEDMENMLVMVGALYVQRLKVGYE